MTTIFKSNFSNTTVNLDDQTYVDCHFRDCILVFSGGPLPQLQNNIFENCNWRLAGAAGRTMQFLVSLYRGGASDLVEEMFADIRNGSGNSAIDNQHE